MSTCATNCGQNIFCNTTEVSAKLLSGSIKPSTEVAPFRAPELMCISCNGAKSGLRREARQALVVECRHHPATKLLPAVPTSAAMPCHPG
jgi:hypothetical protein